IKNVFREDEVVNRNEREQLLKNAPRKKDGSFVVPKTVE
ncbi:MAG TPA: Asp-tRNA(Asn)/Glu-tRNA(Gln) amidotransferase GatCAB subunit C, partial [Lachnospiraceae bacterium]|nr:Asp-tRNA(Asn)/Glu-tRNA(Gln) amidotransferase GatCAB subunit C [Lachnospiraceae bacterium]